MPDHGLGSAGGPMQEEFGVPLVAAEHCECHGHRGVAGRRLGRGHGLGHELPGASIKHRDLLDENGMGCVPVHAVPVAAVVEHRKTAFVLQAAEPAA